MTNESLNLLTRGSTPIASERIKKVRQRDTALEMVVRSLIRIWMSLPPVNPDHPWRKAQSRSRIFQA